MRLRLPHPTAPHWLGIGLGITGFHPRCWFGMQKHPNDMEQQSRERREYDIRPWSSHSDENHVTPRMIKRGKIHRHRLGVSEQKWRSQNQQECWQQDRPKWVDVLQWIESYPPETIGGGTEECTHHQCSVVQ